MCDIKSACIIICLAFGFGDGYQCKKKNHSYLGCPVYKIESRDGCQSYLETNGGDGNFVFYIKPLTSGHLNISLYKRNSDNIHTFIYENLFAEVMDIANQWHKIKIRRDKGRQTLLNFHITYFMEINDQQKAGISFVIPNVVGVGNEFRVKTVTSLWSFTCDPSLYHQPKVQTTKPFQQLIQIFKSVQPIQFMSGEELAIQTTQPSSPAHQEAKTTNNETIAALLTVENLLSRLRKGYSIEKYQQLPQTHNVPLTLFRLGLNPSTKPTTLQVLTSLPSTSFPLSIQIPSPGQYPLVQKINTGFPVWQLAIIASATLVLTLVIILISVLFFVRHKKEISEPVPIQPRQRMSIRLSRQVSRILGYSMILDHNYEEVNLNSPEEPKNIIKE